MFNAPNSIRETPRSLWEAQALYIISLFANTVKPK